MRLCWNVWYCSELSRVVHDKSLGDCATCVYFGKLFALASIASHIVPSRYAYGVLAVLTTCCIAKTYQRYGLLQTASRRFAHVSRIAQTEMRLRTPNGPKVVELFERTKFEVGSMSDDDLLCTGVLRDMIAKLPVAVCLDLQMDLESESLILGDARHLCRITYLVRECTINHVSGMEKEGETCQS